MGGMPYPATEPVLQAFTDAWLVFALELLGFGLFLLWASREPLRHTGVVWLVVLVEALRGILADVLWIVDGFSPWIYSGWVIIHAAIIVAGVLSVRQARSDERAAGAGVVRASTR